MFSQPEKLRRISSGLTFFTKFVSPLFALIVLGNLIYLIARHSTGTDRFETWIFLLIPITIIGFHIWNAYRVKSVMADSNNLYVSSYFKETTIPLSQIANVTEMRWIEPRVVTIHLRSPSEFGEKIPFLATYRFFGWYSEHPIVNELKEMAGQKTYKEISNSWLS